MTQPTGDQSHRLDLQKKDPSLQRSSSIRLRVPSVLSSDGPRRPRDRPGFPWDHPGRPWEEPGTTASPGIQDHAPHSPDPLQWQLAYSSTAQDESPLNFNAALDVESKRAISEDEDAEGDCKKISAAQYEIFRQAVTTSKGSYKVNPAKTKRASGASLLDLGDTEVPDRVSWLYQPSLQDTMASTARIAQGLKEDEEVVKTTLSETLNDNTSSFKFFTVKQIFPREPYRLKIHRDALYAPKPPGDHGFIHNKTPSSYHLSHRVCLDTEELAWRSAIYASLADSMVASVIEELSPKDERTKLLREKLTIIQEAQVSAVSAGFAAASNLQLLRRDALLKNFNFQPQVLSAVRTAPFEGYHVVGPETKVPQSRVRAIRQADRRAHQWLSPSRKNPRPARRRHPRRRLLDLQCLTGWAPLHPQLRGLSHRSRPFELAPSGCPKVSAFRGQQEGVPVHLSSVWTGDFSTGVHQAAKTRRLAVEAARCEATRLLRPLTDQGRYTGTSSTARPDNHQGPPVSWLDHQLREVRPHTKSRLPVHWDAVQHSTFHSGTPAENACKGPVSSSALDSQSEHNCQRSAQTSRHAGVHGLAGLARTAPSSSSPMVGCHSMVPEDRELVRPDSSSTVGSVRGGMVVIPSSPARSTPRHQGDGSNSLHRCVQFGLGSPVRLTLDTGTVVSISKIVPHKRSGDAGYHLCCERLPTSSEVPSGATDVRQRSDGGVHQERGGHEIAHFDADDHTAAQVVRQQGDYVGSRPSARSAQHPGGFPVQTWPDTDQGVDDGHGESTTRVCQVGRNTDRFVCDIRQQTTRQVRIAISGPQGGVDRCHVHALGQGEGPSVRIPAIQDGPSSTAEDRSITRSAGDTDRSNATGSIMVPRADGPIPRRPDSAVRKRSRPADTRGVHGRRRDRDSSLPAVKSTCVETLRAILRAKGHSREAANMMSRCLRESSQQVYESHWSRFVAFCRTQRWHVFQVRSHHFSTYMMHLFRDGLLPSTIISHRTSVASVLRHWVYNPAADPHIKLLVRAFRLERPVQRRIMPKWDLNLVLLSLLRPPFTSQSEEDGESSDDVIPLKWQTLKCVFLASARERSYLHALSIAPGRCVFARGNTQRQLVVSLLPEPGFLAKNQLPTQAPEWITVPGIAHLNPTEPERMLCPLRQLKLYIPDSERIRGGRQRMFIHWNHSIRDIMRSHISRWIVETVKEAYTQADRQYDRVTAHEVRALSASWAYNCQVALPDILSVAFWRSSGVFQNSYLRDMACIAEGMSTLGPVVVAQHVVDPGHLHPPP